jgi:hypothetical protein
LQETTSILNRVIHRGDNKGGTSLIEDFHHNDQRGRGHFIPFFRQFNLIRLKSKIQQNSRSSKNEHLEIVAEAAHTPIERFSNLEMNSSTSLEPIWHPSWIGYEDQE